MRNLTKLYEQSGKDTDWYVRANEFAHKLSAKYHLPLPNVVAIISALSPSCRWEANKLQAEQLIKGKRKGFTTYQRGVDKAIKALTCDEPSRLFNERTGAKTYHFYHCILNPYDYQGVVIDRHAYTIATGLPYNKVHLAAYRRIAKAYVSHSRRLSILPMQLQAALWVNHTTNVPF